MTSGIGERRLFAQHKKWAGLCLQQIQQLKNVVQLHETVFVLSQWLNQSWRKLSQSTCQNFLVLQSYFFLKNTSFLVLSNLTGNLYLALTVSRYILHFCCEYSFKPLKIIWFKITENIYIVLSTNRKNTSNKIVSKIYSKIVTFSYVYHYVWIIKYSVTMIIQETEVQFIIF